MINILAPAVLYIEFVCMMSRVMSMATEGEGEYK